MRLIETILSFDGTHVGDLKAALSEYDDADAEVLPDFCESDNLDQRAAATWLVKGLRARARKLAPLLGL